MIGLVQEGDSTPLGERLKYFPLVVNINIIEGIVTHVELQLKAANA